MVKLNARTRTRRVTEQSLISPNMQVGVPHHETRPSSLLTPPRSSGVWQDKAYAAHDLQDSTTQMEKRRNGTRARAERLHVVARTCAPSLLQVRQRCLRKGVEMIWERMIGVRECTREVRSEDLEAGHREAATGSAWSAFC